jgi:hypothetical protein
MDTDLVTLREASRTCGVSQATIDRWVRGSGVRLVRAAGEKWIKRSFLAGFLRGHGLPVPFELDRWFVPKPFEPETLRAAAQRLLGAAF